MVNKIEKAKKSRDEFKMGQSQSSANPWTVESFPINEKEAETPYKEVEKLKPEPTFVELMQTRAIEAQQKHNAAIEKIISEELTEEARAADILVCVEDLLQLMIKQVDLGQRELCCEFKSPLFTTTWEKVKAASVPGVFYKTSFSSRLMQHAKLATEEFSRRTKIPVSPEDFSTFYRTKIGCQVDYNGVHDGYNRVGFWVRY